MRSGATAVGGATALLSPAIAIEPGAELVDVVPLLPRGIDGDVIGAATSLDELARSRVVTARWPAIAAAAACTATPQVRALATVGGTLGARLPTADLPAALAAHGSAVIVADADGGVDEVDIMNYLGEGRGPHLVLGVRPTVVGAGAYRRFALRLGPAPAIATVAGVRSDGGLRLFAGACGRSPAPVELSPAGEPPVSALRSDARGSADYRRALVRALALDVLAALEPAR